MPIYEYRCGKCGEVSEALVLGREERLSCSSCGSEDLTKLMSAPNISMGGGSVAFDGPAGCGGSPDSCGSSDFCGSAGRCCGG